MSLNFKSKLPQSGESIFAKMTGLANKFQAINLAQGFPNFSPPTELFEYLKEAVGKGFNQYAPMPGLNALREQIAIRLEKDYNYPADIEQEITISAGATQALYSTISALVGKDDKVIIFEPAYDCYGPTVILNGGKPIYLKLQLPDFSIPWNELEDCLKKEQIKLMIINNPHNPAGRLLSREDLIRLDQWSAKYNCLLIWDEVYDLLVYDEKKHISALEFPSLMDRSCVIFSMGKTLHNTGWKIGYTVAKRELTNEVRKVHQFMVFSVNAPAQYAIAKFMQNHLAFFDQLPEFYQEKRDYFFKQMESTPYRFLPCEGSYFALASYAHLSDKSDNSYVETLVEEKKVALIPLSPFYHDGFDPRLLRFCFAKTEEVITSAARALST